MAELADAQHLKCCFFGSPGSTPGGAIMRKNTYRKLHINDEIWQYKIFYYDIEVRDPQFQKHRIEKKKLFGCTPDDISRAYNKKSTILNVTPSQIKKYI